MEVGRGDGRRQKRGGRGQENHFVYLSPQIGKYFYCSGQNIGPTHLLINLLISRKYVIR